MGPKKSSRSHHHHRHHSNNEMKSSYDESHDRHKNHQQRINQMSTITTKNPSVAPTKSQPKSRGFFCCCGASPEDVYNREIPNLDDTYAQSSKELSSSRSYKNQTNTSNGSTASVASNMSLPSSRNPQEQLVNNETTKRAPSRQIPSRTNIEIADVTELDTSVGSTEKNLPHTRSFVESQSTSNAAVPSLKPTQSRLEMKVSTQPTPTTSTTPNRDNSALHGVYGTVAPVTATVAPNPNFNEMNRMFDVLNIKFDRSQPSSGEQIAAIGDAHLAKLEEGCKVLLDKLRAEKQQRYQYFMELNSTEHENSAAIGPPPLSGDYTEVALIYTEVLQLQNRPRDAVQVLSKAIEILNTDLIHAKHHRQSSSHGGSASPNNSFIASSPTSMQSLTAHLNTKPIVSTSEFDQLKKMKGNCHRRLGSLYKLLARYSESEDHIKKYISILNRQGNSTIVKRDKANAYALLATIYELMDKKEEAVIADKQALEMASSLISP